MKSLSATFVNELLVGVLSWCSLVSILRGQEPIQPSAEAWHVSMSTRALPGKGCFNASYPVNQWNPVSCTTPPQQPYGPRNGAKPSTVGNGNDFSAEVSSSMSTAQGSFASVTNVISECGNRNGIPPATADTFSLQLNTKPFTTALCSGSPNSACRGWQQFVYSNAGVAFIQYWLLQYNKSCPTGWNTYSFSGSTDIYCWMNGANGVSVTPQNITSLASLSLTGSANSGGTDTVIMTTAAGNLSAANQDSILGLASKWKGVEFIIVGDCCSSEAYFNSGAKMVVKTNVSDGSANTPACVSEGFTGETNNLTLVPPCNAYGGTSPYIEVTEGNAGGAQVTCTQGTIGPPTSLSSTVH